jgi:hypothetical protein
MLVQRLYPSPTALLIKVYNSFLPPLQSCSFSGCTFAHGQSQIGQLLSSNRDPAMAAQQAANTTAWGAVGGQARGPGNDNYRTQMCQHWEASQGTAKPLADGEGCSYVMFNGLFI